MRKGTSPREGGSVSPAPSAREPIRCVGKLPYGSNVWGFRVQALWGKPHYLNDHLAKTPTTTQPFGIIFVRQKVPLMLVGSVMVSEVEASEMGLLLCDVVCGVAAWRGKLCGTVKGQLRDPWLEL